MRDRLVELIEKEIDTKATGINVEWLADYLLANGVIVAPMPMADWLKQELTEYVHKRCVEEL